MKTTVIIPMAGQGSRFGYKFKPFLKIENETFIERTIGSFKNNLEDIDKFIFIYLKEQEEQHNVQHKLNELFPEINFETVILDKKTKGPAETIIKATSNKKIDRCIICDCDHWLSLDLFFEKIKESKYDCIIPTWEIEGQDVKSEWSVVSVEKDKITGIAEKSLPDTKGDFMGVIGCIYFNQLPFINNSYTYVSDVISDYIKQQKSIISVELTDVEFFGDPSRLETTIYNRNNKKGGTVFCDIDGTIIEHESKPNYNNIEKKKTLQGYKKLLEWKEKGYKIILTTARPERQRKNLEDLLLNKNITYDQLIMGLPSGERHLINDRKPSFPMNKMAIAHEIERNTGLSEINLSPPNFEVISKFKGGSMADTFLIKKENKLLVRKIVSKKLDLSSGYLKLKKQFQDLNKMKYLDNNLFPEIYGEEENSYEYYYDMEYLNNYQSLSNYQFHNQLIAFEILFPKLQKAFYNNRTVEYKDGSRWLLEHLSSKIFSKLEKFPQKLKNIIKLEEFYVNGEKIQGLTSMLEEIINNDNQMNQYSPSGLSMIHGDLTLENILYKPHEDIKLIDMDGANVIDAVELDLGKMFQSLLGKYESWSSNTRKFLNIKSPTEYELNIDFNINKKLLDSCLNSWKKILDENNKIIYKKALFYTGLHFIRMIPFRLNKEEQQYITPLLLACKFINAAQKINTSYSSIIGAGASGAFGETKISSK
tara:strand:+ start:1844 stop:3961 length:2118 start_codon:yes stop_codon:yes gene_type:complete